MPTGGEYYLGESDCPRVEDFPHSGSSPLDCYRRPGGYLDPLRRSNNPSETTESINVKIRRPDPPEVKPAASLKLPPEPTGVDHLSFATNSLYAGAFAAITHGPVARGISSLARDNIAHSISALGVENLKPSVSGNTSSMSHWWEERFGVDDGGKLLDKAANKEIELNALIRLERERSVQRAAAHIEHFGTAVASTWKRAIDSSLNETEKVLFAGYQFLNSPQSLKNRLEERGVIPGKFTADFQDPKFIKEAKEHGPELMTKVKSNFSPSDVYRLKDFHENLRIATRAVAPPLSQREADLITDKKRLFETMKIPRLRQLAGSVISDDATIADRAVRNEGLGPILTSVERSSSTGGLASMARGVMFATGVQLTSDLTDRLLMPGENKPRSASLYANTIGTSLALCMDATPAVKVATALGIGLLGCAIDSAMPAKSNQQSQESNEMSPAESAAIGIASGLPLKAPGLVPRLGLIGASVIVGKLVNEISKTKL